MSECWLCHKPIAQRLHGKMHASKRTAILRFLQQRREM